MSSKHAGKNDGNLDLPEGIRESDCKYPETGNRIEWSERQALGIEDIYELKFYKTNACGWVLCVLPIKKARRADRSDRTYAIGVKDRGTYRVGNGPHVLKEITVHFTKDNIERLKPFIELYGLGSENSNTIRDRISSRRAQGQLERARGNSYWRWDS